MIDPAPIIPEDEISVTFVRSSGPGGQNVNKVATAAQLRFDVRNSPSLPDEVKQRLMRLAGRRMTADGVLVIEARRYREQERNRLDAITRLNQLVDQACQPPEVRRATRPTASSMRARLENKRRRGALKRVRRAKPGDLE